MLFSTKLPHLLPHASVFIHITPPPLPSFPSHHQGSCTSNVKGGAGLSSGYYTYETEMGKDYLIPKPTTGVCLLVFALY